MKTEITTIILFFVLLFALNFVLPITGIYKIILIPIIAGIVIFFLLRKSTLKDAVKVVLVANVIYFVASFILFFALSLQEAIFSPFSGVLITNLLMSWTFNFVIYTALSIAVVSLLLFATKKKQS